MADFLRENTVEIMLGLVITGLIIGFAQGWLGIAIQYVVLFSFAAGGIYYFYHHRVKRGWTYTQGDKIAQNIFVQMVGKNVPIQESYDITDGKKFSRKGRLYVVFGTDGPRKMAVGLDLASKKLGFKTSDIRSDQGLFYLIYKEPKGGDAPTTGTKKIQIKEESKTN